MTVLASNADRVGPKARKNLAPLIKHYMSKPHPFTACVRDNTKRFGPERAKKVCAVLKDIGTGTTKWRKGGRRLRASIERDWAQELYAAAGGDVTSLMEYMLQCQTAALQAAADFESLHPRGRGGLFRKKYMLKLPNGKQLRVQATGPGSRSEGRMQIEVLETNHGFKAGERYFVDKSRLTEVTGADTHAVVPAPDKGNVLSTNATVRKEQLKKMSEQQLLYLRKAKRKGYNHQDRAQRHEMDAIEQEVLERSERNKAKKAPRTESYDPKTGPNELQKAKNARSMGKADEHAKKLKYEIAALKRKAKDAKGSTRLQSLDRQIRSKEAALASLQGKKERKTDRVNRARTNTKKATDTKTGKKKYVQNKPDPRGQKGKRQLSDEQKAAKRARAKKRREARKGTGLV